MLRGLLHGLQRAKLNEMQKMLLQSLDRMEAAEITHVALRASNDERDTPVEKRLDGHRMTIKEARRLVIQRPEDIPRSTFEGKVEF